MEHLKPILLKSNNFHLRNSLLLEKKFYYNRNPFLGILPKTPS